MDTEIILLGHGSRRREANQALIEVAQKVEFLLGRTVVPAFMGHANPSFPEALREQALKGVTRIIVMPLFLFDGMHVTHDIHEQAEEIRHQFPQLKIIFSRALGADDLIASLASARIKEALEA